MGFVWPIKMHGPHCNFDCAAPSAIGTCCCSVQPVAVRKSGKWKGWEMRRRWKGATNCCSCEHENIAPARAILSAAAAADATLSRGSLSLIKVVCVGQVPKGTFDTRFGGGSSSSSSTSSSSPGSLCKVRFLFLGCLECGYLCWL